MSASNEETVLSVHHWTDRLFSFTTTRDMSLRTVSSLKALMVTGLWILFLVRADPACLPARACRFGGLNVASP